MDTQPATLPADAGEPQTEFLLPQAGGSYIRNPDGSLTKVSGPDVTAPKE